LSHFFSAALGVVDAAVAKPTIVVNQVFSLHTKVDLPHAKVILMYNKCFRSQQSNLDA
jgi:hypothetical protein